MKGTIISDNKLISIMILFLLGTAILNPFGSQLVGSDFFIPYVISLAIGIVFVCMVARLHQLYPGKNLYQISEICFGKVIGKIFNFMVILYVLDQVADVANNYLNFMSTVGFDRTPITILAIVAFIMVGYMIMHGMRAIADWSVLFLKIYLVLLVTVFALLIKEMDITNMLPLFTTSMKNIMSTTGRWYSFPMTQLFVFLLIIDTFETKKSPYKVYILGLIYGTLILLSVNTVSVLVLGVERTKDLVFFFFNAISMINVQEFFRRLEIVAGTLLSIGAYLKMTIFAIATLNGVKSVFNINKDRIIIVPLMILAINITIIRFQSIILYYVENQQMWKFYAGIMQTIIPLFVYFVAEGKNLIKKLKT